MREMNLRFASPAGGEASLASGTRRALPLAGGAS